MLNYRNISNRILKLALACLTDIKHINKSLEKEALGHGEVEELRILLKKRDRSWIQNEGKEHSSFRERV